MASLKNSEGRKEQLEKYADSLKYIQNLTEGVLSSTLEEIRNLEAPESSSTLGRESRERKISDDVSQNSLQAFEQRTNDKSSLSSSSSNSERAERTIRDALDFELFGDPAIDAMISISILHGGSAVSSSDIKAVEKYVDNSSNLSLIKLYEVGKSANKGSGNKAKAERLRNRSAFLWAAATKQNLEILFNNGAPRGAASSSTSDPIQLFDRVTPAMNQLRIKGTPSALLLCLVTYDQAYKSPKGYGHWSSNRPQRGFDCVIGTGRLIPDHKESGSFRGQYIPHGKTVTNTQFPSYSLTFNEYIFHNPKQVSLQFIAVVK